LNAASKYASASNKGRQVWVVSREGGREGVSERELRERRRAREGGSEREFREGWSVRERNTNALLNRLKTPINITQLSSPY
jgi:hypothetical protein